MSEFDLKEEKRKLATLEQSIVDIDKFEKDLHSIIKAEKDIQQMYKLISKSSKNISKIVTHGSMAKFTFESIVRKISTITNNKGRQQHEFKIILDQVHAYKLRTKEKIHQCGQDIAGRQSKYMQEYKIKLDLTNIQHRNKR